MVRARVGLGISDLILEYLLRFRKIIKVFENARNQMFVTVSPVLRSTHIIRYA